MSGTNADQAEKSHTYLRASGEFEGASPVVTGSAQSQPQAGPRPVRFGFLDEEDEEEKSEGYHTTGSGNARSSTDRTSSSNGVVAGTVGIVTGTVMHAAGTVEPRRGRRDDRRARTPSASPSPNCKRRSEPKRSSGSRRQSRGRSRSDSRSRRQPKSSRRPSVASRSASSLTERRPAKAERTTRASSSVRRQPESSKAAKSSREPEDDESDSSEGEVSAKKPAKSKRKRAKSKKKKTTVAAAAVPASPELDLTIPTPGFSSSGNSIADEDQSGTLTDALAQIRQASEAGTRRMTLGPKYNLALAEGTSSADLSPAERQVVDNGLDMWLKAGDQRVSLQPEASVAMNDEVLEDKREEILQLFSQSWLHHFDIMSLCEPSPDVPTSIILDGLTPLEQVGLLQTVLYLAGYSFHNLIPAMSRGQPPLVMVTPVAIQTQVFSAQWVLSEMVTRYHKVRRGSLDSAERAALVATVSMSHRPPSLISSSDWSDPQLGARGSLPQARAAVAGEPQRPVRLSRSEFTRQVGLGSGTPVLAPVAPPQPAPVNRATLPAFDEPMREASQPVTSVPPISSQPMTGRPYVAQFNAYQHPSVPFASVDPPQPRRRGGPVAMCSQSLMDMHSRPQLARSSAADLTY